jgi:wyosine [tRNA(Phe)-imidazoG37] synthetase (radical SAM superfamily)
MKTILEQKLVATPAGNPVSVKIKPPASDLSGHTSGNLDQAYPRDFLGHRFVYLVISPLDRGLSIGVDVNPVLNGGLQWSSCEIDRDKPARASQFDVKRMAGELRSTFALVNSGRLRQRPRYANLPDDLLQVRHVALRGDGEPTWSSHFAGALETLLRLRALPGFPFFKIVVVTNSTALDRPKVRYALQSLACQDEIWSELDGSTQVYLNKLNGAAIPLKKIMDNILLVGRQRPVIIQSLFAAINGAPPAAREIKQYVQRLKKLKKAGAEISLVQIYSATRSMAGKGFNHLPLKSLSDIAKVVRQVAGLRAEVF